MFRACKGQNTARVQDGSAWASHIGRSEGREVTPEWERGREPRKQVGDPWLQRSGGKLPTNIPNHKCLRL